MTGNLSKLWDRCDRHEGMGRETRHESMCGVTGKLSELWDRCDRYIGVGSWACKYLSYRIDGTDMYGWIGKQQAI